jgi:hypothetical protein
LFTRIKTGSLAALNAPATSRDHCNSSAVWASSTWVLFCGLRVTTETPASSRQARYNLEVVRAKVEAVTITPCRRCRLGTPTTEGLAPRRVYFLDAADPHSGHPFTRLPVGVHGAPLEHLLPHAFVPERLREKANIIAIGWWRWDEWLVIYSSTETSISLAAVVAVGHVKLPG